MVPLISFEFWADVQRHSNAAFDMSKDNKWRIEHYAYSSIIGFGKRLKWECNKKLEYFTDVPTLFCLTSNWYIALQKERIRLLFPIGVKFNIKYRVPCSKHYCNNIQLQLNLKAFFIILKMFKRNIWKCILTKNPILC